jgi:hypothetical protein
MIVLANRAASELFAGRGQVLGCDLHQLFPGMPDRLPEGELFSFEHRADGKRFTAEVRPMGSGSQSRGWLIAINGIETD